MAFWTQSSFVRHVDILVSNRETGVVSVTRTESGCVRAGQTGYAPGQGPGVGASASSSTLVSNSRKPRLR